jgi:hypothetical protein
LNRSSIANASASTRAGERDQNSRNTSSVSRSSRRRARSTSAATDAASA